VIVRNEKEKRFFEVFEKGQNDVVSSFVNSSTGEYVRNEKEKNENKGVLNDDFLPNDDL